MEIRKITASDIPAVIDLWYETSLTAHSFISAEYWKAGRKAMAADYLPNAETIIAVVDGTIAGFASMTGDYLAALFVRADRQKTGIGKILLENIKKNRDTVELKVYAKNTSALDYYLRQNFRIITEDTDQSTGEKEFIMRWNR